MEGNTPRKLPQIPGERLGAKSNVAESSSVHQSGPRRREDITRQDEQHTDMQQRRISARVSQQQFQESVMLLRHKMDAQKNDSRQRLPHGLQRRPAVRYTGTPPRHRRQFDGNTPPPMSTNAVAPESKSSGHISTEACQNSSGESYVEKHREAQQVHTRAHPGDISSLLQSQTSRGSHMTKKSLFRGRGGSDHPRRRRYLIRKRLAPMRQYSTVLGDEPAFYLQNEPGLTTPPNWPFGVTGTSGRNNVNQRAQHRPLTQREIRLLLRNPLIRDGNMGPLPVPDGVTPPRPPPHVYGIASGPPETGIRDPLPVPRLTGLERRNAQRRSSNPTLQEKFESHNDRFNARFRRGSAAKDVHSDYSSPLELARESLQGNTRPIFRIEEESHEPPNSESTQETTSERPVAPKDDPDGEILLERRQLRGEAGAPQKDGSPQRSSQATQEQEAPSGQKTKLQNDGNKTSSTKARIHPSPRRFPLVVKGPRPAPASLSTSSSAPSTPPSSAPPTAATQISTPTSSESEPKPKSEHLAQDEHACGTAGCTWKDCSRIRGTSKMPLPGAAGESKPENSGSSSAVETRSEDDIVSVGNGFSFLRLN